MIELSGGLPPTLGAKYMTIRPGNTIHYYKHISKMVKELEEN